MNAFGYIRTSGHSQTDNDGFPRQRAAIEKFAAAAGFKIIRWFQDEAVSGTNAVEDRPGFTEMVLMAGPATAQTIIVECQDRLARTLIVQELAILEAEKLGLKIFSADSGNDLTVGGDPTKVLIRQVLGALAEWNKSSLVARLREARKRKRVETGLPCGGPRRTLDGEALALVLRLRDELGQGWTEIAVGLNRREIPTPRGKAYWTRGHVFKLYTLHNQRKQMAASTRPAAQPRLLDGLPV